MGLPALAIAAVATTAIGTGVSLYSASQQNKYNQQMINEQEQQNKVREAQMNFDAQRKQLETIRNQQRARAAAQTAATAQGAQFGSGLQGGYGQIQGGNIYNTQGIQGNLDYGQQMFALDAQMANTGMSLANARTVGYFGQGISSLGGDLMSGAKAFSNLTMSSGTSGSYNPSSYYSPQAYANYAYGNYGIY